MQTAKASRKQSSLSGKESDQGCLPKRLLGRPDEALGGGKPTPNPGPQYLVAGPLRALPWTSVAFDLSLWSLLSKDNGGSWLGIF